MRQINLLILFILPGIFSFAQTGAVYLTPHPADVTQSGVRIYVDISSDQCDCEILADADPNSDPLYIWSWFPREDRPLVNGIDVDNGSWENSNENLRMSRDEDNPNLWYYDFLGLSPAAFFDASSEEFSTSGIHFLIKKKDATGTVDLKSTDLLVMPASDLAVNTPEPGFDLELEQIASGLSRPCEIVNDGVHGDRMYILEQPGRVRMMDLEGNIEPEPLLSIEPQVLSSGNEQGLLGLAFAPDFAESGHFFVNYTRSANGNMRTKVARFTAAGPDFTTTVPGSEVTVLEFVQDFSNHNGGQLSFGPEGYLYVATGDGGAGGDPNNRAQDLNSFLGKMLRIDVSELPYTIPADNPFINDEEALDEIWAYGLRNPWKNAFDEETGDFYMADVGQLDVEEVNFEPAGFEGGANYGWRCFEGSDTYNGSGCNGDDYVFPIMEYAHQNQGNGSRCSITGGRVYRGNVYGNLVGKYFSVDLCSGEYWVNWQEDGEWQEFLSTNTLTGNLVAFGADLSGELYAVRSGLNGTIHKVKENCSLLATEISLDVNVLTASLTGEEYQWFVDGSPLTVTDMPTLEIDGNGAYSVFVSTSAGCNIASNSLEVTTLSTADYAGRQLGIFPNPASSNLRIVPADEFSGSERMDVSVFGVDGRLMMRESRAALSENGVELDVESLPAGFYIVRAEGAGISASGTFMKE